MEFEINICFTLLYVCTTMLIPSTMNLSLHLQQYINCRKQAMQRQATRAYLTHSSRRLGAYYIPFLAYSGKAGVPRRGPIPRNLYSTFKELDYNQSFYLNNRFMNRTIQMLYLN